MTTDEIAAKFKQIYELKKQIKGLMNQRRTDEIALAVRFKVDECNQERNALAVASQTQINVLAQQIAQIEDELGN